MSVFSKWVTDRNSHCALLASDKLVCPKEHSWNDITLWIYLLQFMTIMLLVWTMHSSFLVWEEFCKLSNEIIITSTYFSHRSNIVILISPMTHYNVRYRSDLWRIIFSGANIGLMNILSVGQFFNISEGTLLCWICTHNLDKLAK